MDASHIQERYRYDRSGLNAVIKDLSQVSGTYATIVILTQWVLLLGSAALATMSGSWLLYLVAWLVIASRQHALSVLIHDAVHFRLYRNKTVNDLMSDVFCAYPLGASTALYRDFHLKHHRYTNTELDPEVQLFHSQSDWKFPKSKREIMAIFGRDLMGLNSFKTLEIVKSIVPGLNLFKAESNGGLSSFHRGLYIVFTLTLVATLTLAHLWVSYLIFWIVPTGMTAAIFRLRMMAEHHGVPNDKEINGTRTVLAGWLETSVFAPFHVNYHLEHHMFPSVPFFNLKKLHQRLLQEPDFAAKAHFTSSYLGRTDSVFQELSQRPHGVSP